MDFILSYNNNEVVMPFPVIPNSGIVMTRGQGNEVFEGVNYQLQSLGTMELRSFELSSIFPTREYSWARPGSSTDGWAYVRTIEVARERRIPFRAIYLDNQGREIFNLPVSIDSFEYGPDAAGDVAYTLQFTEYRFAQQSTAALSNTGTIVQQKAQTTSQAAASSGNGYTKRYTNTDAVMMGRVMYLEARGIRSKTEIACVGWTILNRVDDGMGTIQEVITAPNQFAYKSSAPTISDYGYDLVALATDVLDRWSREKAGETNVGRVLPQGYLWYAGDGKHNYFRNKYKGGTRWDYSLASPYES